MVSRSKFFMACMLSICAWGMGQAAHAQAYPDKPIKLVVPFPPGGATDSLGRVLATAMGDELGQSVVVENRPGAGTVVAASAVSKSPADGYTLFLGASSTLMHNLVLRPDLPYDPFTSFTPIGLVADMGLVLLANPNLEKSELKEVLELARSNPGKLTYSSFGVGSSSHFAGEALKSVSGADITHIAYNGSGPSLTALMGGHVDFAVDTGVASASLVNSGKVKAVAAMAAERLPNLPDVPTVAESGFPGFDVSTWFTLLAPAGLPEAVLAKLEATLEKVLNDAEMQKKLVELGLIPHHGSGKAVMDRVDAELPEIRKLAETANIKLD
ncbi:MAG TPA: tripartite tricarboxylate transporter substrate binding protein [Burkholderiaceae bacterium]|nr:tripartite tricarboxylate transporter substrate binding protein [Burkholderiaceae bacterium]